MATKRRGRLAMTLSGVVVVTVLVLGALALSGRGPASSLISAISHNAPPPTCPLTGEPAPGGVVPQRPALAIKVENLPESRPQTGLNAADIVYEEPVEVFITRFIAVYQCHGAPRVEPVRSVRLEDPDVLRQFGHPLLGYSGGVPKVKNKIRAAGIHDVNAVKEGQAYLRDSSRVEPHNLYTSTAALWKLAPKAEKAPDPIFTYSTKPPVAPREAWVHLPYSDYSDVYWRWSRAHRSWLRYHGTVPHTLSNGQQVHATNVVVQVVKVTLSRITDVNGVHSPFAHVVGHGKAYVFRNGRMVVGTWSRPSLSDVTVFKDAHGDVIALNPGNTWVELFPSTLKVTYGK